jgi:hypothetical protein
VIEHQLFATVALLMSEWLDNPDADLADDLRRWVCGGAIRTAPLDEDRRHQAICCLHAGRADLARSIAAELARRNPDSVDLQLLHVEALASGDQDRDAARAALATLRAQYTVGPELRSRLEQLASLLA